MEPFFDGGLFELLIAIGVGCSLNFIFKKRYMLILYSAISIMAALFLPFTKKDEIFLWLAAISIFNTILLIILMWRQRLTAPGKPLIETDRYIDIFRKKRDTLKRIFKV